MKLIISHQRNNITIEQDKKVLIIYPFDLAVGKISADVFENEGDMLIGTGASTYDNVPKRNVGDVWTQGTYRPSWQTPAGGSTTSVDEMNFRLSLSATLAVTTADQTAKTIVYIHPYKGDKAMLNVGGSWIRRSISISSIKITDAQTGNTSNGSMVITGLTDTAQLCVGMEVTGTGVGASALIASIDSSTQITTDVNSTADGTVSITFKVPADTNIDYFLEDISGVAKLRMLLWTDDTNRASAITLVNGKYLLDSDNDYNYIGSGRTTDTAGETEDSFTKRFVWNYYGQILRLLYKHDDTNSWARTTTAVETWHNTTDNRVEFIIGVSSAVWSRFLGYGKHSTSSYSLNIGIGLDSISVISKGGFTKAANTANYPVGLSAFYDGYPEAGYHYLQMLQHARGSTTTYYGDGGDATRGVSAMTAGVMG